MTQTASDTIITDLERAKLLLDEWKFRQKHCWSLLPRYGLAAVIASIIPYVKIELFKQYNISMLIFPCVGWLLALAATWLFFAEQFRCYSVLAEYRKLIGKEKIHKTEGPFSRMLDRIKIRWVTPVFFFATFTALSVINWLILKRLT
ncbi:MAG TPA: hypothetical protein VJ464_01935 [Blastocatellia bacterium]|nr:hypothetical protein [Blastocatellia bacterium]